MSKLKYVLDDNGCWNVTSHAADKDGYPRIRVDGKQYRTHRYMYEKTYGELLTGLIVRHKCDNRICCNPDHLELGSHYDNVQDRVKRQRSAKGERNGRSKLTEKDIRHIRNSSLTITELSNMYNVDRKAIRKIIKFETWKHVV